MSEDDLGDRMKGYEMAEAGRMLIKTLPIMIRLDGKAFHTFTKGLKRPYDERLSTLMANTTKYLVEQTNALVGYTQSDEISLVLYSDDPLTQVYFDGRIQKLTSVVASMTTMYFNKFMASALPEKADKVALFDCRVWNVPTLEEAAN
jgi:tRNA(His) guanylyltransferase